MTATRNALRSTCFAAAAILAAACGAHAQSGQNVPNALQGFTNNRDKPIQIKAQTFEVRDKDKKATFSGNVHVVQGDATIRCRTLVVTYSSEIGASAAAGAAAGARLAQPGPGGKSQISKLEALGGVIVTQKDQTATGETGVFDLNTKIITLVGNVVISQGGNVMRGDRMIVDLNNGVSRIESGRSKGPVQMIIPQQGEQGSGKPGLLQSPPSKLDMMRPAQPN